MIKGVVLYVSDVLAHKRLFLTLKCVLAILMGSRFDGKNCGSSGKAGGEPIVQHRNLSFLLPILPWHFQWGCSVCFPFTG
jgi:hypothetical protein